MKKPVGIEVAGETPSLTGEFVGETHRVLESTQTHPPRKQYQKGPICLWVVGEVTESQQRAEQTALLPLRPLPHIQRHKAASWVARPGEHLRLPPLLHNRYADTKNMAQMKEQIKAPEKMQLKNKEIANLSDAQFKTLGIRMLTELVEYNCKMEEKENAMKSEIKKNVQGTTYDRKETGTQINSLDQKEEINIQPEQNEETRIQKNEERLRNPWDNFNVPTSES